jgi:hypothetical protein
MADGATAGPEDDRGGGLRRAYEDKLTVRQVTFQPTTIDVDINTSDTSTPTHNQILGPITRARARQLNNQEQQTGAKRSCIRAGDIWILEQQQLVTASLTTYEHLDSGLQILSGKHLDSPFICIKPQAHIMSEPVTIIILVQRPFSAHGAATPYFGPLGRVSC